MPLPNGSKWLKCSPNLNGRCLCAAIGYGHALEPLMSGLKLPGTHQPPTAHRRAKNWMLIAAARASD